MNDIGKLFGDTLVFAAEEEPAAPKSYWRVLIVDDDEEVHRVTRLVLDDFYFNGRGIEFLSAMSGRQAKQILAEETDIAVILLDVVMETDDAGLQVVSHVRETLQNNLVRIILRTGQPGVAPERSVIIKYDVNDYKSKSELTSGKLFTAMVAGCRSYQDLITIENSRRGLEKVIDATSSLFELQSMGDFLSGSLQQLAALLEMNGDALLCLRSVPLDPDQPPVDRVQAATGRFASLVGRPSSAIEEPKVREAIDAAFQDQHTAYFPQRCAVFFQAREEMASAAYLEGPRDFNALDRQLAELFCSKAAIAFVNLLEFEKVSVGMHTAVHAWAKMAEARMTQIDLDAHLRRVEMLTGEIATELKARGSFSLTLDSLPTEKLALASILHDIGNGALSDAVISKTDRFTETELAEMRRHSLLGAEILTAASARVPGANFLGLAAEIARFHQERYDGSGYPMGLSGDDIPLSARIVAVADVFDALTTERPYRPALSATDAIAWIRDQAGAGFDPEIVEAFTTVLERPGFRARLAATLSLS